ncbi:MAG: ribonuclease HI [Candidatus Taylorbacteria bacterium]|nr:ribonuclease HI [Candidatus Taylorbacteria bacterium]
MEKVIIYTDGSSRGNPGPGGWGTIIMSTERVKEIGGREGHTTNNRMELRSVIEGLRMISGSKAITVCADSEYVVKGITQWINGWIAKGWRTTAKKAVLNQDLWQELLLVTQGKNISWQVVKGHAGVKENERADVIATSFAEKIPVDLYDGPRKGWAPSFL